MKKILYFIILGFIFVSCSTVKDIALMGIEVAQITGTIDSKTAQTLSSSTESISKLVEKITPENEYYIGRSTAAMLVDKYSIYNNEKLNKYLNNICGAITSCSSKPYLYKGYFVAVLNSDEINAMATPGGHIFVTRGMLKCVSSEDELASVIAHEVAHIQLQHGLSVIKSSRFTDATLDVTKFAVVKYGSDDFDKFVDLFDDSVNDIVSTLVNNGFSQSQEFDADEYALTLLNDSGYNPHSFKKVLEKIKLNQVDSSSGFVKTHPDPDKRINKIAKLLDENISKNDEKNRYDRFEVVSKYF